MQMAPSLPKAIIAVFKSSLPSTSGDTESVPLPDTHIWLVGWKGGVWGWGRYLCDPLGQGMWPLEEGMAIHYSVLAWRIPWTEEPGGLQSIGSQGVGQDWNDLACRQALSAWAMGFARCGSWMWMNWGERLGCGSGPRVRAGSWPSPSSVSCMCIWTSVFTPVKWVHRLCPFYLVAALRNSNEINKMPCEAQTWLL